MTTITKTTCCIAGGGPAGMMLGLLLARAGIPVIVLEKHKDFFRDFRGDTVHPSTMQLLDDLGLIDRFLALRHTVVRKLQILTADGPVTVADFSHLRTKYPYIALVPQWDLLNLLAEDAKRNAAFTLLMEAEATRLEQQGGAVTGLYYRIGGEEKLVRAGLIVAADGRHSVLRDAAQLPLIENSPPMDVLWFSLPRVPTDPEVVSLRMGVGKLVIFINRFDYWQVGYVVPKGRAEEMLASGVDQIKTGLVEVAPELGERVNELRSVDQVKLLTVQSNRLRQWWLPGFLCIGDAAHAMTPVGGVGINLAIQDAVAAANQLWRSLREGKRQNADLQAIQRRRTWPTIVAQALQATVQKSVLVPVLASAAPIKLPFTFRLVLSLPVLQDMPARAIGIGVRPERPSASLAAAMMTSVG